MSQPRPRHPSIHRIDRRAFLKGAAGGAVAVTGLEGILAARRAPAFAQTVEIKVLQWVDFIPEGDVELRRLYAEYSEQMKVKVTLETINANDLQARITAAIQSGAGPDVIMMLHNWPHLYQNGLADVSDLCEWKGKEQGGYYQHSEAAAKSGQEVAGPALQHRRQPHRLPALVVRGGRRQSSRRRPSTSTARSAPRSRRRASRSGRPSGTPSGTRPPGPTRSCGASAGPRWTRAARRWC